MTDASGILVMNGVVDGDYTLVSVSGIFANITYTVLVDYSAQAITETFIISAQFKRISRFLVIKLGEFYFFFFLFRFVFQ